MKRIRYIAIALVLSSSAGCAGAINAKSAHHLGDAANEASKAGDWTTARQKWAQALVNAQLAGLPNKQLAIFNYEYGRSLGVQCFWEESEKYLQRAHELDHETGGPEFMSLLELSRLKYDQGQFAKSIPYYSRAIDLLEKANAPTRAPTEFAVVLDEYATALKETGNREEALSLHKRAKEIRLATPDGKSITDRTPYGKYCPSSKK
jgi:tetratricopeptide (TPR) repeat protein